jgi:hypothetical protein
VRCVKRLGQKSKRHVWWREPTRLAKPPQITGGRAVHHDRHKRPRRREAQ